VGITPKNRVVNYWANVFFSEPLLKSGHEQFVDVAIGIKAEANLAMPDVADRHPDPQLATARLGASGVEHAGAQHTHANSLMQPFETATYYPRTAL
jgi:hypothetical protein